MQTMRERWRRTGSWSRFTVAAVVLLAAGAVAPESLHVPGPAPDTLPFTASELLDRWNAAVAATEGAAALSVDALGDADRTHAGFVVRSDADGIAWRIEITLDRLTGRASVVEFSCALAEDEAGLDRDLVGVAMTLAAVEGLDFASALPKFDELLETLEETTPTSFAASMQTAIGSYHLTLSEQGFLLEVVP